LKRRKRQDVKYDDGAGGQRDNRVVRYDPPYPLGNEVPHAPGDVTRQLERRTYLVNVELVFPCAGAREEARTTFELHHVRRRQAARDTHDDRRGMWRPVERADCYTRDPRIDAITYD